MLIDVAVPGERNVIKKEAEMILKYKDLKTQIQRMWNMIAKVIPVIIWATGIISKTLRQYLSNIPGKQKIKELQKHCTHTAESAKYKTYFTGEITLHVAQTVHTEQL